MKISLGYQVLFAVFLGILTGLFLGSFSSVLQPIGDIYTMLLQMAALPYICLSLIHGIGSMTPSLGKKLLQRGWFFWLILWGSVFFVIYALSFMIPRPLFTIIDASSNEEKQLIRNFLNYLVPKNPLYDLVNNIIPAIVAFGLIFGIALMHLRAKEPLLSIVERGTQLVEKILLWLAIISPLGIFIRCAVAFGTIYFEEISSIGFYVMGFIFASLVLTFWILPLLLSSFTAFSYRETLKAFRSVCLLPFATGLPTLALPLAITYMKTLSQRTREKDHFDSLSQTALPICYSLGQIGNCMALFFILFISFFFRHPFSGWEKAILSIFMIPMSFGSSTTSLSVVSYLIEQLRLPIESIALFKQGAVITLNFQVLMSSASILTFLILVIYSYYNRIQWRWKYFLIHFSCLCLTFILAIGFFRKNVSMNDYFNRKNADFQVADVLSFPVHAKIFQGMSEQPRGSNTSDPFAHILRSGVLRVGYSTLDPPYSYLNQQGELCGYDIAYAYQLAKDLDCTLELIPIRFEDLLHQLEIGEFDVAMASVIMDEERIKTMEFTAFYKEEDFVLVALTAHRARFLDLRALEKNASLRLVTYGSLIIPARRHFPLASIEIMNNNDPLLEPLLQGKVDGALWTRVQASAWCGSHVDFVPLDYGGALGKCFFAYPVKLGASTWASFLNHWLVLKSQDGFQDAMVRYWIEGEKGKNLEPRWSILRNILHWVD